jgi:hypothetical protein
MKKTRLVIALLGAPAVAVALSGCCTAGMDEMDANAAAMGSRMSALEGRIGDLEAAQRQTTAEVESARMTAERAAEAAAEAKAAADANKESMERMFTKDQEK